MISQRCRVVVADEGWLHGRTALATVRVARTSVHRSETVRVDDRVHPPGDAEHD